MVLKEGTIPIGRIVDASVEVVRFSWNENELEVYLALDDRRCIDFFGKEMEKIGSTSIPTSKGRNEEGMETCLLPQPPVYAHALRLEQKLLRI